MRYPSFHSFNPSFVEKSVSDMESGKAAETLQIAQFERNTVLGLGVTSFWDRLKN